MKTFFSHFITIFLFISSAYSQNVGIGTTIPVSRLHVSGTSNNPSIPGNASTGIFRIGINTNEGIDFGKMGSPGYAGWIQSGHNDTLADPLALQPVGGNVGIGTTTPNATLHINGTVKIVDGTQGIGKVLQSDSNGLATWVNPSIATMFINVRDFGAISNDGINDAAAIEAAILYAYTNKYGIVYFPPGFYLSNADSITLRSNIHYVGYGAEIRQVNPNTCIFYADTVYNAVIEGLSFTGLGTDYNATSTYAPRRPAGIYQNFTLSGGNPIQSDGLKIINCNFKHFAHSAIYTHDIKNVWIQNNKIIGIPQLVAGDNHNFGINLSSRTVKATVTGNHIDSTAQGIVAQDNSDQLTIIGNRITDVRGQHGIYLSSASNSVISNNILTRMANNGILMPLTSANTFPMENNVVSNNVITDARNFGISISLFDSTTRLKNFNISNNQIINSVYNDGADAVSIKNMDHATIAGNSSQGHRYGLRLSNIRNTVVSNHTIYNSYECGIFLDGVLTDNVTFDNVRLYESANRGVAGLAFGITLIDGKNVTLNNVYVRDTAAVSLYSLYIQPTFDQPTLKIYNSTFLNTNVRFEPSKSINEYSRNLATLYNSPASITNSRYGDIVANSLLTGRLECNNVEINGLVRFLRPAPNLIYSDSYAQPISIDASTISLQSNNTSGKVGIGTATPNATLHVNGKVKIADGSQGIGKVFTSDANGLGDWVTPIAAISGLSTNYIAKATSSTTIGNSQIFDNGTNVGINLASPSYTLDVNGSFRAVNYEVDGIMRFNSGSPTIYSSGYTYPIRIDGASVLLNTNSGGNVGVGTSIPATKLEVAGAVTYSTTATPADPQSGSTVNWFDGTNMKWKKNVSGTVTSGTLY